MQKNEELRPCYVDGKKALLHKIYEKDLMVCNSLSIQEINKLLSKEDEAIVQLTRTIGGFVDKKIKYEKVRVTVALVEYESGELAEVAPNYIRFIDTAGIMAQYAFEDKAESEGDAEC